MMSGDKDDSDFTFEEFLLLHQPQLQNSCVPQLYWETLFIKLKNEVFDASKVFEVQCIQSCDDESEEGDEVTEVKEYNSWQVVVTCDDGIQCADKKHIYLVDHAWSYRQHEARQYLLQVPGLSERMAALMDVSIEGRDSKDIIDDILKEMWRFNQTYRIESKYGTNEGLPVWYVMDEFGSRIQHSDMPTFKTAPFMYGVEKMAYTILWPLQDLDKGDEVTRDYAQNNHHPERRKAMLLPWLPCDFKESSFQQPEPPASFFCEHRIGESDYPEVTDILPVIPTDRKLKVCLDYDDAPELTDARFELVETGEEADILWTTKHFKDFKSLYNKDNGTYKYINQYPSEQCITLKDLLAAVCRRAGSGQIDPDTLEGSPAWLPVTYNLNTELVQFISYYQHRHDKDLDNVWIIKPWNMSNSMDICVTDNLNQIVRLTESGPKIACKYISNVATLWRPDISANVKVDLRFLVFVASVDPLQLYVYRPFSVRRAHKEYGLTDFDDLLRHLTYVGFYDYKVFRPGMYTEEFIDPFLAENPDITWEPIEESIHQMLLDTFTAAASQPVPAGLGNCPLSRSVYGIDCILQWDTNDKGERVIQPMLCEINFSCDYISWKEEYPDMINDAFSALFFDDTDGREERVRRLAPTKEPLHSKRPALKTTRTVNT